MSYNVDSFKVKRMEGLKLPLKSLYESKRSDWHPDEPELIGDNKVIITCGCGQEIEAILEDGYLTVTKLNMSGEGSGSFIDYVLFEALKQSTGYLEAILIWEGGDSITRLIVDNGELSNEECEL